MCVCVQQEEVAAPAGYQKLESLDVQLDLKGGISGAISPRATTSGAAASAPKKTLIARPKLAINALDSIGMIVRRANNPAAANLQAARKRWVGVPGCWIWLEAGLQTAMISVAESRCLCSI